MTSVLQLLAKSVRFFQPFILVLLAGMTTAASAYPLDGYSATEIRRLEFYRLGELGEVNARTLPSGALQPLNLVDIRLAGETQLALPEINETLSKELVSYLGDDAEDYGVSILDLSNPDQPVYAAHNDDYKSNVGSVGKVLVAVALFNELARIYPDDLNARMRILKTELVADKWIQWDGHEVQLYDPQSQKFNYRELRVGDKGSLWEYLDWMLSASSNAAAGFVQKQMLLMRHFGRDYPPTAEQEATFFDETDHRSRGELFEAFMNEPLTAAGLDTSLIRQGSFFTRHGKYRVAGKLSYATPEQLVKLLYAIETGKLIDRFSSREIKRLLYVTQKRIRYASHPALRDSAVYFKTGSLYSCTEEPGFTCGKYMGNRRNILASVAIIESPAERPKHHYLVAVISNKLRVNSAVAHQTLAMRIHRMLEARLAEGAQASILHQSTRLPLLPITLEDKQKMEGQVILNETATEAEPPSGQ